MTSGSKFLDLARKQADLFMNNNIAWIESLVTTDCIKSIMEIGYNVLVRQKAIVEIGKMPIEEKENLWESTKEFCRDRLTVVEMKRVAKALICLEYLLT